MTWSEPVFDPTLVEPTCQASLLRYSWAGKASEERSRILFPNPVSDRRVRLMVRLSYDEGRSWPVGRVIDPGSSAYCSLTRLTDGRVGLLYESGGYRRLTFVALELDWLLFPRR